MNSTTALIASFLGGAIAGACAALLLAPESGEDLRKRIADILRKRGILCTEQDIDALVEKLTEELHD